MDQLKSMRVFVDVVEAGSFAAVAERFGMTAPMIGRHVRALEERLGAQLLNRTTRRHALTEAGRIYYERSKDILAELEVADASVAQMTAIPRGVLRVGAPAIFGSSCLAPALPAYLLANPELRVELTLNNRVLDLREEGYDVVIRAGTLADSGLIARRLAPYQLVACAAPDYLSKYGAPTHPDDLASHSCLGFHPGAAYDTWTFTDQGAAGGPIQVQVNGPFSANSGQALRQAALGGAGIVLQSEALLAEDLAASRLVRVLMNYPARALPLAALYAPTRVITPKLRSFLDFLTDQFGPKTV